MVSIERSGVYDEKLVLFHVSIFGDYSTTVKVKEEMKIPKFE